MINKRCWGCHGDARKLCDTRHVWCRYKNRTNCPDFKEMTKEQWDRLRGVSMIPKHERPMDAHKIRRQP